MLKRLDGMVIAAQNKMRRKAEDFLAKKNDGLSGIIIAVGLILIAVILIIFFKTATQRTIEGSVKAANDRINAIANELSK